MLFQTHETLLRDAVQATRERSAWSGFTAITPPDGQTALDLVGAHAGTTMRLSAPTARVIAADEVSPYTGAPLGVRYAAPTPDEALTAAEQAGRALARAHASTRVGACLEALTRIHGAGAEVAAATSHTTGQSLGMACTGSGTNALDRGLEAVAMAWAALQRIPASVTWQQRFGRSDVTLHKTFRPLPLGPALVIACASFPAWNAYPAILVNLATGNPVLVKPHPRSVLATAIAVREIRGALVGAGLPADAVQLLVDTEDEPIAAVIARDHRTRIVDFTGSQRFGSWLETNLPGTLVFTETSGINTVILDSVRDWPATVRTLATGLALFSGQMCTTPQNIYLADAGVGTPDGPIRRDQVVADLVAALDALAGDPRRAAAVCGALHSPATARAVDSLAAEAAAGGRLLRAPTAYDHPDHPRARTMTPALIRVDPGAGDEAPVGECFGPVAFLVHCTDVEAALTEATAAVAEAGAISSYLYSTDDEVIARAEDAHAAVGASLSSNLVSSMPMQYAAAYSDYHVTGLNRAGNATLTDESFVAGRFRVVQARRQVGD